MMLYLFQECTDSLLNQLDDQLKITEEECKDYRFDSLMENLIDFIVPPELAWVT